MEEIKTKYPAKLHWIVGSILLIFLVLILFKWKDLVYKEIDGGDVLITQNSSLNPDYPTYRISFPAGSFSMAVPYGWFKKDNQKIVATDERSTIHFVLEKNDEPCVVAYVRTPRELLLKYKQTSFADQIDTGDGEQNWGSWYVSEDMLPVNFQFLWQGRQSLSHEVRINYYPLSYNDLDMDYSNTFLLFNKDNSPVSASCNADFSTMLTSIQKEFKTDILTKTSKGRVFFQKMIRSVPLQLMYTADEGDGIAREIMRFDEGILNPTIYKNNVFFISNGGLKVLDIFSRTVNDLPGIETESKKVINEFYIFKDRMFYLLGPDCNSYKSSCSSDLFEYDFNSGKSKFLVSSSTSREIIGFDDNKNTLGMSYMDGDAGCFWLRAEQYNFNTRSLDFVGDFDGCYGYEENGVESTKPEELIIFENFESGFGHQLISKKYMRVENGKITLPQDDVLSWGLPLYFVPQ